ncbi:tRNA threonylcarbamoyl adenosine modification protein YjeE [Rubrobacter radiotolerans]|uniref:tRNA threonylcarbamoyladenosine biosynthesis protein TsaE n=1 Tax=Rubrobacter radiotolerans TaxID=42256 RepID=A0A023X1N5_RUBRA|nr:tRNA (adenosine(37)-N6)-threonylcarbamoyltransferase complex ATPase subunit type 1 TsaE [Rubrobacter radiotolerans]AHY45969.1 tRNA threonylcarbamoyl adenosine modification protein YjeE [Rubrobacter radiotolerans]MDX5893382.1 tRNA (adenosine(37)-N6)-threonylcarbamoyltransferase complex ATPase subunit type 1 TsaE [Rubrobacter radiotolerans]SMC03617.1 tRNA threonylcarbamoyladenosine biosynthesis protein TsaE [Rubrobacter radiotolerans DSM 5868]
MEFRGLDQDALERLAGRLARRLKAGDVVVLSGEVGAGKTTFTRAACAALGVAARVTSPTYQLARSYSVDGVEDGADRKITSVNHLDLYRVDATGSIAVRDALDLDEYLTPGSVTFIEWAEPAAGVLREPTVILFEHESETTRRLSVRGPLARRFEKDGEDPSC